MAETKAGGKKIFGVPEKTAGLAVGAAVLVYLAYSWYTSRQSSTAASGVGSYAPAIAPGAGSGSTTTGSGGSGTSFSSLAAWEEAVMGDIRGTLGAAGALNAVTDWLNSNCVSAQAYTALGNAIQTRGLPPGFGGNVPQLTVCSGSGTTTPAPTGTGTTTPTPTPGTGSTAPTTTPTTPPTPATGTTPPSPTVNPIHYAKAVVSSLQLANAAGNTDKSLTPPSTPLGTGEVWGYDSATGTWYVGVNDHPAKTQGAAGAGHNYKVP